MRMAAAKPAIAQSLGRSFQKPMKLTTRAAGGAKRKRTPARSPNGEPQPKPGMPTQPGRIKSQGEMAKRKPIFPNFSDSMRATFGRSQIRSTKSEIRNKFK